MNKTTLLKLKKNPFYKMNDSEKSELEKLEKESRPIIVFGDLDKHNNRLPIHDTFQKKRKTKKKKVL